MNLKLIVAVVALAAMPMLAQAQQKGAAPPPAAKAPTKAEVQKVVNQIKGDKAKLDTYCQIVKLGDQAQAAAEKKDQKKMDDLNKQAETLGQNEIADLLQQTLDEEGETNKKLTSIASKVNKQAKAA